MDDRLGGIFASKRRGVLINKGGITICIIGVDAPGLEDHSSLPEPVIRSPSKQYRPLGWERRQFAEQAAKIVGNQSLNQFLVPVVTDPVQQEGIALRKHRW